MTARKSNRTRPGVLLVRIVASLLLAASLAMLFLPWISLRFEEKGSRYTLRELTQQAARRGVPELPSSLTQRERQLYTQLLPELDALRDDRMSPLRIALGCLASSRVLSGLKNAQGADAAFTKTMESYSSTLSLTGLFLLVLLGFLALTCVWAICSALVGYGVGVLPYLVCSLPAVFALAFSSARLNAWYQGTSSSARALNLAVQSYRLSSNPAAEPFRLTGYALLFPALLAGGVLLAFCALRPREGKSEPRPQDGLRPDPALSLNTWRCPQCGTLMGDGVYCVNCGARKLEPRLCSFCGERLEEGSTFCSFCGTKVPRPAAAPADPGQGGGRRSPGEKDL